MTDSAKSISEVQEAEANAEKLLSRAKGDHDAIINGAREKASKMIADAEEGSEAKKAEAIKKVMLELEEKRKKAMERAASEARAIKSKRLSERSRTQIAKRLADLILGA